MRLPLEAFYENERAIPGKLYLRQPLASGAREITWGEAGNEIRRVAAALKAMRLPPGSNIAILSKNCAHWMMADLAIWMAGHVSVPLYPNSSPAAVREILAHSGARLVFLGKLDAREPFVEAIPHGVETLYFHDPGPSGKSWDDLVAASEPLPGEPVRGADELATIIYTSGTTGTPKGVMHSFRNIAITAETIVETMRMRPGEVYFSYLPLAHVAERVLCATTPLYVGGTVHFAQSLETFAADLAAARPTIFLAVPRIWTKFQMGVLAKMPQKKLDRLLAIPLVAALVKRKIKAKLGLDRARIVVTGAAPLPTSTYEWFLRLGFPLVEAYGMTENFALSHCSRPDAVRLGTVGQAYPGVDVKLSEEGEILVKSPGTMLGYYREPELSAEAMSGEYLRTGDRGVLSADGFLTITGRVKELFKTSKGKYVAPSPIEMRLARSPHVEQVCLVGSGFPQPFALVTLSETSRAVPRETVSRELDALVTKLNETLDPHERISNVVVFLEGWTPDNGLLTPTMKIKRNEIETRFGKHFERWSYDPVRVLWHGGRNE